MMFFVVLVPRRRPASLRFAAHRPSLLRPHAPSSARLCAAIAPHVITTVRRPPVAAPPVAPHVISPLQSPGGGCSSCPVAPPSLRRPSPLTSSHLAAESSGRRQRTNSSLSPHRIAAPHRPSDRHGAPIVTVRRRCCRLGGPAWRGSSLSSSPPRPARERQAGLLGGWLVVGGVAQRVSRSPGTTLPPPWGTGTPHSHPSRQIQRASRALEVGGGVKLTTRIPRAILPAPHPPHRPCAVSCRTPPAPPARLLGSAAPHPTPPHSLRESHVPRANGSRLMAFE